MDPISAAGFASAVLTFVEFSCKLIKGSYDIYHSDTNAPAETASISVVLKDLDDVTETLRGDCHGASHHRDFLKDLAAQCLAVSGELSALLKDLERKEGNKVWRSVEAKWNMMRKEKDMASLEQRLASLRQQLLLRLTTIMSEEQSSVKATLAKIQTGNVSLHSQVADELTAVQESIQQLETALATQLSEASDTIGTGLSGPLAAIQQVLSSILARLDAIPKPSKIEQSILRRLHFPQIWTREDSVGNAEFDTFNWLLDLGLDVGMNVKTYEFEHSLLSKTERDALEQARREFLEWLETGSSAYHISGKAGSGKSTLMKFLFHHPRVRELLQQWAGSKKLVIAAFFFWSSGTQEEKSLRGLYKSILFQVLRQCPDLLQHAFPQDWAKDSDDPDNLDATPFQLSELKKAMELMVSRSHTTAHRFIFFIDGLDEFEVDLNTDYKDLADDVLSWAKSPDVKLCVSSRPYVEFFELFPASQRIALHDLTKADLRRFVSGALSKETASDERMVASLSHTITNQADGVFLWVRLVVRSVVEGIRHRYTLPTLHQRVEGLPRGLEPLYVQLFENIDPLDRPRSDMMLLIALAAEFPLDPLIYSWIDDLSDPEFPFRLPARPYTDEEVHSRHEDVKIQLYALSKGLMEIRQQAKQYRDDSKDPGPLYFQLRVDFLHRTVRDFIQKPDTIKTIVQRRFGSEDALPHIARSLQRLLHASFKFAPPGRESLDDHHAWWRGRLANSFFRLLEVRIWGKICVVEPKVLKAHEEVLSHHAQITYGTTLPWGLNISPGAYMGFGPHYRPQSRSDISFGHYMVSRIHCHEYMRSVVAKMTKDLLTREGPSLLVTSLYSVIIRAWWYSDFAVPADSSPFHNHLLQAGVSPQGEFPMVRSRPDSTKQNLMATPWVALLMFYINGLNAVHSRPRRPSSVDDTIDFWPIIEAFLAFGADPDVFFEFALFDPKEVGNYLYNKPIDFVCVGLEDLVLLDRPLNEAAVLKRISARRGGWLWGNLRRAAEMMLPWIGVSFGLPKLEPARRRISVAELEKHMKVRFTVGAHRVYTRSHDICTADSFMIY